MQTLADRGHISQLRRRHANSSQHGLDFRGLGRYRYGIKVTDECGNELLIVKKPERGKVVKAFSDPNTEAKYLSLGFVPEGPSLNLSVGKVSVYATGHPWKGAVLVLESVSPGTMTQYDIACPTKCSAQQIAGLIYMNIAQKFRDSKDAWKTYFDALEVALFQ